LVFIESDLIHPLAHRARWRWLSRRSCGEIEVWQRRPEYDEDADRWSDPEKCDSCAVPWRVRWLPGEEEEPRLFCLIHSGEHYKKVSDQLEAEEVRRLQLEASVCTIDGS
jgi:hypothetical protein